MRALLLRNRNIAQAYLLHAESVKLRADDANAHNDFGGVLTPTNKLVEVINSFRESIVLNPEHAKAHYNLGLALMNQWKLAEADKHFQVALRIQPDYVDTYYTRGRLMASEERFDETITFYRKSLKLNTTTLGHSTNGVWFFKNVGKREKL